MANRGTTKVERPPFVTHVGDQGIELDKLNLDSSGRYVSEGASTSSSILSDVPPEKNVHTSKRAVDGNLPPIPELAGDTRLSFSAGDDTAINSETAADKAKRIKATREALERWEPPQLRSEHTLAPRKERQEALTIAPKEQSRAYKALVREYVQVENRIVEIEERIQNAAAGGALSRLWAATLRFANTRTLNALREELTEIRSEQSHIIESVHRRARELKYDSFINDKKTPNLLRRAGIPEEKQNKLPEFSQLASALNASCLRRLEAGKTPVFKIEEQSAAFARITDDGSVERIMLRHHSDGRVSLFKSNAETDGEWKRVGVIWTDDAYKITQGFLNGKQLPPIKRPPVNTTWIIDKVKLNADWEAARRKD